MVRIQAIVGSFDVSLLGSRVVKLAWIGTLSLNLNSWKPTPGFQVSFTVHSGTRSDWSLVRLEQIVPDCQSFACLRRRDRSSRSIRRRLGTPCILIGQLLRYARNQFRSLRLSLRAAFLPLRSSRVQSWPCYNYCPIFACCHLIASRRQVIVGSISPLLC